MKSIRLKSITTIIFYIFIISSTLHSKEKPIYSFFPFSNHFGFWKNGVCSLSDDRKKYSFYKEAKVINFEHFKYFQIGDVLDTLNSKYKIKKIEIVIQIEDTLKIIGCMLTFRFNDKFNLCFDICLNKDDYFLPVDHKGKKLFIPYSKINHISKKGCFQRLLNINKMVFYQFYCIKDIRKIIEKIPIIN